MQYLFHFRFSRFRAPRNWSSFKRNSTNLIALIESGFVVIENVVFLFTNAEVLLIAFKFIINV